MYYFHILLFTFKLYATIIFCLSSLASLSLLLIQSNRSEINDFLWDENQVTNSKPFLLN